MMRCLSFALLSSFGLPTVLAGVHELWWNVTYVENVNPDGLYSRRAVGVNGTWPPPPIDVSTNDTILLHAYNSVDQPMTLHHHGMFFNSTSWMDGAAGVSQCGIPTGQSFDYQVDVNSSGQWGTYWIHGHANGQYVDGLRAPLVLHPSEEVYAGSYDEEFTVVLGDWYHQEHSELMDQFVSISNPGGAEPVPASGLIYFAQNGSYLAPKTGTNPGFATSAVGFNENATLPFEAGKTYRLRVINTSAFSMFYFWIDGHDMRIIEADGTDTQEYPIDMLSLTVAQRYSVLVTARNDSTPTNWIIHANMDTDMFDTVPEDLNPNITSTITYSTSAETSEGSTVDEYDMVPDIELVPYQAQELPLATKTIPLEFMFDTMTDGTNHAMFNGTTYNSPNTPAVLSALTLGENATVENAYGPLSFVVDHLDVIDIVIMNADAGKHPFHLHGHRPFLAHRADDYTSDDPTLNPPLNNSQPNPMRRDTVHIPAGGSVTLRVVADNPGVWFLHCHIEWHLEVGLAIQLIEAPLVAQERAGFSSSGGFVTSPTAQTGFSAPPAVAMASQCAAQGLPYSGNAAGYASTTDLEGLTLGPYPQSLGWHARGVGALVGCIITALLGMITVVWYALVGEVTDEEMEQELRERIAAKEKRGHWLFGRFQKKN